jgi:DNA-directed RNA polymerase
MQTFTGTEYLKIDLANQFGLDRLRWEERIYWTEDNENDLKDLAHTAKHPILFRKALRAFKQAKAGYPTNHIMGLDATASGIQCMAAMSGCQLTAEAVNLTNTGQRKDLYTAVALYMCSIPEIRVTRTIVKDPVMTFFYGSRAVPKQVFGAGTKLKAFYTTLSERLPGATQLMHLFQSSWDSTATHHQWTMPDKHVVRVPVTQMIEREIEIDEQDHMRFTYRTSEVGPQSKGRSLAANITHAVDGWIAREMVKMAKTQGFYMAPIHDCFYAHPNYMNQVRMNYINILSRMSRMPMVSHILSEIAGKNIPYKKHSYDLYHQIEESDYALS